MSTSDTADTAMSAYRNVIERALAGSKLDIHDVTVSVKIQVNAFHFDGEPEDLVQVAVAIIDAMGDGQRSGRLLHRIEKYSGTELSFEVLRNLIEDTTGDQLVFVNLPEEVEPWYC